MDFDRISEKLAILADAAKYDVSCASSGSKRKNIQKGLGNTGAGICHSYTADGRCVSLLKILLTNYCIFDCAYCVSRSSNDVKRAAFTVQEVVDLTMNFYRRNYIEGLFLSSGIFKDADYTMERLVRIAKKLRIEHNFNGYIHLKTIPGASDELMHEAGLYADRLSVNLEVPTEAGLKLLAPEKNRAEMVKPMTYVSNQLLRFKDERKSLKKIPLFAPAGQSTQMVIGAAGESDKDILITADSFYKSHQLKRVYYSGYVPVSVDGRLPAMGTLVPMVRENRLYQADWLMRFYDFNIHEIVSEASPLLELDIDPKLSWALKNMNVFPIDINTADLHDILRIPGVGLLSATRIIEGRKFSRLGWEHLKKMGLALNRARFFITCQEKKFIKRETSASRIKQFILAGSASKFSQALNPQLSLF